MRLDRRLGLGGMCVRGIGGYARGCKGRGRIAKSGGDIAGAVQTYLRTFSAKLPPTSMRTSLCIVACQVGVAPSVQCFGVIFAAKDCTAIFPFRTTNVSVASS